MHLFNLAVILVMTQMWVARPYEIVPEISKSQLARLPSMHPHCTVEDRFPLFNLLCDDDRLLVHAD